MAELQLNSAADADWHAHWHRLYAAVGMTQSRVPRGYSAFMGKVGVNENDAARIVSLLTEYALQIRDQVPVCQK